MSTTTARRRLATRALLLPALAALALLVTACGLRLETEPPPPLVPDGAEEVRQRTAADAVALGTLARAALAEPVGQDDGAPVPDDALRPLLEEVAEATEVHLTVLGGLYDPGTAPPEPTVGAPGVASEGAGADTADEAGARATGEGAGPGGQDPATVVRLLADSGATALADAAVVEDPRLARLVAAVAVHRLVAAARLADAVGVEAPDTLPDQADAASGADTEPDQDPAPGTGPQDGLAGRLALAHDVTGQAWEVAAARRSEDARAQAAERARHHRARSAHWSAVAEESGEAVDRRSVDYALPPGLLEPDGDAAGALGGLELALVDLYAGGIGRAPAGTRATLLEGMLEHAQVATRLRGVLEPLPGLPEQRPPVG